MPWVRIDGARYRVPAQLAGTTVTVRENATGFTIWQRETLVATHPRQGRQQVVMVPAPYAGLLRVDLTALATMPPQYDPRYVRPGDVAIRDFSI